MSGTFHGKNPNGQLFNEGVSIDSLDWSKFVLPEKKIDATALKEAIIKLKKSADK